eukprot:6195698-Amphidinium_carterae.1
MKCKRQPTPQGESRFVGTAPTITICTVAPSGGKSQAGYFIQVSHHAKVDAAHWYNGREKTVAQNSARKLLLWLWVPSHVG